MKVAVCISGQMRTYRQTAGTLAEHLIAPHEADVFVHTWDRTGNTNKLILFLPRGFHFRMPWHYWHAQPDLLVGEQTPFERDMPSLFAAVQDNAAADDTVDASGLRDLYGERAAVVVEPFAKDMFSSHLDLDRLATAFPDSTCLNAAPMFYKIWACDQLRQQREAADGFTYDLVIRTRPDLRFPAPVRLDDQREPGVVYALDNPFYEQLGINDTHANDMFFCGDSLAMTAASSVWERLPDYWDPEIEPSWPLPTRGPELVLKRHFAKVGLNHQILKFDPPPYRVVPGLSFDRMIELLRRDYVGGELPDFIRETVGICQAIHGADLFMAGAPDLADAVLTNAIEIAGQRCIEPFVGRAKVAALRGDAAPAERWLALARDVAQEEAYPELFTE